MNQIKDESNKRYESNKSNALNKKYESNKTYG